MDTSSYPSERRRQISLDALSAHTGEPVERLREWRDLGLIGAGREDAFAVEDIEVVRLIQHCLRRGIDARALLGLDEASGQFLRRYIETLYPPGLEPMYSIEEAAQRAGVDFDLARRLWRICGMHEPADLLDADDVAFFASCKAMMEAGLPEDALFQGLRVFADSLARVAEAESRLFHFYIEARLRAGGLTGAALTERRLAAMDALEPHMEPAVRYFHRKGFMRAIRDDVLLHLAEDARADAPRAAPRAEGEMEVAIVFVDLARFTPLAEAMGDEVAADVLRRFSELVRAATHAFDGRVVKQIGDAFMLVFPEARLAVMAAVEIDRRAAEEPQFSAVRSGVNAGSVLYREGDYVGACVNLASRLASEAGPHEVLVTAAVRNGAGDLANIEYVPVGTRRIKGISAEIELFDARLAGGTALDKETDPVCGMELAPADVDARLSFANRDLTFCSEGCLRAFVSAPDQYLSGHTQS